MARPFGNVAGQILKGTTLGEVTYLGDSFFTVGLDNYEGHAYASGQSQNNDPILWWDIAQSHFFTVQIYRNEGGKVSGIHDIYGNPISFASGEGVYEDYIPVKSMNFNYTSYENMNIPLGIFGDFPLLHRKKVTSISFTCYDTDQDIMEKALHYWEQQCFPGDNYVAYLDDIAATLTYTSYDVMGHKNFQRLLTVIPASSVSVSRSYEENAAKILNFSVAVVGAPASGGASGYHNKPAYQGTSPEIINEWKNRKQGRAEVYNGTGKYQEGVDGIGRDGILRARVERTDINYQ